MIQLLAALGLCWILMYSSLFKWLRDWVRPHCDVLTCSMCLGFWCGVIINFLFQYMTAHQAYVTGPNYPMVAKPLQMLLIALASSATCLFVELLRKCLDELISIFKDFHGRC